MAVLQAQCPETGWLAQVCDDLHFVLQLWTQAEVGSLVAVRDFEGLARFSFEHPKLLTKLVKTAQARYQHQLRMWNAFRDFQQSINLDLAQGGVEMHDPETVSSAAAVFPRPQCNASFTSHKALCTHMFKQHQMHNLAQYFAA